MFGFLLPTATAKSLIEILGFVNMFNSVWVRFHADVSFLFLFYFVVEHVRVVVEVSLSTKKNRVAVERIFTKENSSMLVSNDLLRCEWQTRRNFLQTESANFWQRVFGS